MSRIRRRQTNVQLLIRFVFLEDAYMVPTNRLIRLCFRSQDDDGQILASRVARCRLENQGVGEPVFIEIPINELVKSV